MDINTVRVTLARGSAHVAPQSLSPGLDHRSPGSQDVFLGQPDARDDLHPQDPRVLLEVKKQMCVTPDHGYARQTHTAHCKQTMINN